jgi:hypothetical protein
MKVHLISQPDRVITPRGRMTGVHTAMCLHGQTNQATNPERLVTGTRNRLRIPGQTDPVTLRRHVMSIVKFTDLVNQMAIYLGDDLPPAVASPY